MNSFVVTELQTMADGASGGFIWTFSDLSKTEEENRADAEAKYHSVLAVAAKSNLPCHAAVLMRNDGAVLNKQAYTREVKIGE